MVLIDRLPIMSSRRFRSVSDRFSLVSPTSLTSSTDNLPHATEVIRGALGDDYNYDSTVRVLLLDFLSLRNRKGSSTSRIRSVHCTEPSLSAASSKMTETSCSTRTRTGKLSGS